jgi:prevent-host-death family protein
MVIYDDHGGTRMAQYNIAEAKARFSELVQKALSGEEVIIARDNKPLLRIVALESRRKRRKPGSAKGLVWISPDFDETPDDFGEYT